MVRTTEVDRATERHIAGGPVLPVSALMGLPFVGAGIGAIVAIRFLAIALVASPGRAKDVSLLLAFVLTYAAVVYLAAHNIWLMAAGTFSVSFVALSVMNPRLEGRL